MHVMTSQKAAKITFPHFKLNPPEQKKLVAKSSILVRGKSCVLPNDPFLHSKLTTFQCIQVTDNDLPDRWSAITRQEGGIAASNVCLQAFTLFLPSPRHFLTPSQNREPVHRLGLWTPNNPQSDFIARLMSKKQGSSVPSVNVSDATVVASH